MKRFNLAAALALLVFASPTAHANHNYTGDRTATQTPGPATGKNADPIAKLPDDGDALNVASIVQGIKEAMDFIDFLTHKAAILDQSNIWSAIQVFTIAGDGNEAWQFTTVPTAHKSWIIFSLGGSPLVYARFNVDIAGTPTPAFSITINAQWDTGNTRWAPDNSGLSSFRLHFSAGQLHVQYIASGTAHWTAWDNVTVIDGTTASLTQSGLVAGTALESISGDITADAGNIVATAGYINAAAGSVIANADLVAQTGSLQVATSIQGGAGAFTVNSSGVPTKIKNQATTGNGVAMVVASAQHVAWSAGTTTICTFTPPADGLYEIWWSANTGANGDTITLSVTYSDPVCGSKSPSVTSAVLGTTAIYSPAPLQVRAASGVAITVGIGAGFNTTTGNATIKWAQ